MNETEYQRRVAEIEAYREQLERLRDQIRATGSENSKLAIALAFMLGIAVGIAGSYLVAGEQVTNIIFCEKDAVSA